MCFVRVCAIAIAVNAVFFNAFIRYDCIIILVSVLLSTSILCENMASVYDVLK